VEINMQILNADHALGGSELGVSFRPHPQKGKGTTPMLEFDAAGNLAIKGCGSPVPSL